MAVFRYVAVTNNDEGHTESGTIVARDKLDALDKLRRIGLRDIRMKKLEGFTAFFKKMTADIK